MAQQTINIGTVANDGNGDTLRAAYSKINTNFTENYASIAAKADNSALTTTNNTVTAMKVFQIADEITAPTNRTYIIDLSAPFAYTINSLVVQLASGTATLTVQINGVNVTGLGAVAASSTLSTTAATAARTVAANAKVTLIVSGATDAVELNYALRATRN